MPRAARSSTDNLYIPFGGFYPENWLVERRPWRRSLPRLLARHRARLAPFQAAVPFAGEPDGQNLNTSQHELDRLNTELGFLHPQHEREDLGKNTQEGRYRVRKEIWTPELPRAQRQVPVARGCRRFSRGCITFGASALRHRHRRRRLRPGAYCARTPGTGAGKDGREAGRADRRTQRVRLPAHARRGGGLDPRSARRGQSAAALLQGRQRFSRGRSSGSTGPTSGS